MTSLLLASLAWLLSFGLIADRLAGFDATGLAAVRLVTPDERIHEQILREVLQATSRMDLDQPPAAMSQAVHRRIRELCQDGDPYRASKSRFNRLALDRAAPVPALT